MKGTGSQAVVAALEHLAVTRVFGMPGVQTLELFDAFADASFETILATEERAAAFMADAHARVTGQPGVLVVTPGPSLTNALTGLAEALLDSSPVLALVGSSHTGLRQSFQLHAIDHGALLKPVVKASFLATTVANIPRLVLEGARISTAGEPGPVAVELPHDLLTERGHFEIDPRPAAVSAEADGGMLDEMAAELVGASSIGIYVGRGAVAASDDLQRLAELLQSPVATTISGRGILPEDHPLSVGFGFGPCGQSIAEKAFRHVDTLLAIGCKYGEPATGSFGFRMPRRHLHIDINPQVLGANYPADLALVADAGAAIRGLLARLEKCPRRQNVALTDRIAAARARCVMRAQKARPLVDAVTPARFLHRLREAVDRNAILVTDSGSHQFWALNEFSVYAPNTFLAPADFQSMGFSIPAAIAAKLAHPTRHVISLVGDGGFMLSAMELATAQRLKVPLTIVVFCDGALGLIQEAQRRIYRRTPATTLTSPDFGHIAQAFGMRHVVIGHDGEISVGLAEAAKSDRSVIVEVKVRYDTSSRYFQGAARTAFAHLPWDRKARVVFRRLWRAINRQS